MDLTGTDKTWEGTHGTIDGVLPPQATTSDAGATGSVTIHVEF